MNPQDKGADSFAKRYKGKADYDYDYDHDKEREGCG
jgi:hypothetical protein